MPNEKGKKDFQVKFINRSYRIRGNDARTHKKIKAKKVVSRTKRKLFRKGIEKEPQNKIADNNLINKILVYSAIKIKVKVPPLYSVLNPDTNSDSPSAKSKGERFVSARVVANQVKKEGIIRIIIQDPKPFKIIFISKERIKIKTPNKIRAILTSYEIVWAILRSAPSKEYLELDLQPAIKVV